MNFKSAHKNLIDQFNERRQQEALMQNKYFLLRNRRMLLVQRAELLAVASVDGQDREKMKLKIQEAALNAQLRQFLFKKKA